MRVPTHPAKQELELVNVLHALSDPVRLEIVASLGEGGEMACHSLDAPVSKSTLSHHLKVLREAGITHTRADGTERLVSLRRDDLDACFPGLLSCVLSGLERELA